MDKTKRMGRFAKLVKRVHVKSPALAATLYKCLQPTVIGAVDIPSCEDARAYLNTVNPDYGTSSLREPVELTPPAYDLAIIIAAYNMEHYIRQCLDSILSQQTDYKFVIKVVDDCSTDNTPVILEEYASKYQNIIIFHNKENLGQGAARNVALQDLNTRYVMCVDADDYLGSGVIQSLLDKAFSTNADVVEYGFHRVRDNGEIIYSHIPAESDDTDINDFVSIPTIFLYRSELFRNIVFPSGYWYEDVIFETLIFPQISRAASVSEIAYYYRMRETSVTTSHYSPKQIDSLYSGVQAFRDGVTFGLWRGEKNIAYLSDYFFQLVRKTYMRTLHADAKSRFAIFAVWKQLAEELNPLLNPSARSDKSLLHSLLSSDYASYELHCITHSIW